MPICQVGWGGGDCQGEKGKGRAQTTAGSTLFSIISLNAEALKFLLIRAEGPNQTMENMLRPHAFECSFHTE